MQQTFCNTRVEPEEELMQCPYDPVHRILPKRMQTHLIKCRKAILGQPTSPYYQRAKDMVVCKFNSKHHVQNDELDAHHFKCPDKKEFFSNVATETENGDPQKVPGWMKLIDDSALKKQPAGDEESWEDEWQQTYDPMEKINSNTDIIYNPQGLSKAKKRDYAFNRRLQAEGLLDDGQEILEENGGENWGDEDWETNNITTSQKINIKSNDDWSDGEKLNQKQNSKTKKEKKKVQNGNHAEKSNDGWTEVAPRFRKEKQKDDWDTATKEGNDDWGWNTQPTPVNTKPKVVNHQKTNDDGWGDETCSYNASSSNRYTNNQACNDDTWEDEIQVESTMRPQDAFSAPVSNDFDNDGDGGGGWDDGPSVNPYLNQAQPSINTAEDDDEDDWGAECGEFTVEPYIDEWGTVIGSDPKDIASKLTEKQEALKEEITESWGGGVNNTDWTPTIPNTQSSSMTFGGQNEVDLKVKSKLSANARDFTPPGFPPNSKLSRNAMEFTPPGFPSDVHNLNSNPILPNHEGSQSSTTPIVTTDTDTPISALTENESEAEDTHPLHLEFPKAPPSEADSSTTGEMINEDDGNNTFSHEDPIKEDRGKSVDVGLEEDTKKVSVKVPVQQNHNVVHHRKRSQKRGGGRKKKGDNRNRSKSHDKNSDLYQNTFSLANMAVKCLGISVVISLFVILYFITVIMLLSVSN